MTEMTEHEVKEDLVGRAMSDFSAFRGVINPQLQGQFDALTEDLSEEEQGTMMRVLVLAISFGRRLERKEQEPKITLPTH